MRSEKDQMTAGKDKCLVEIQFRDLPREQDNLPGNNKQKEEKKEVFTKVCSRSCCGSLSADTTNMETRREEGAFQHRGQRQRQDAADLTASDLSDCYRRFNLKWLLKFSDIYNLYKLSTSESNNIMLTQCTDH